MDIQPSKYAAQAKDFYLKEYECLRREIDWLMDYNRSVERTVVVAIGITWGWLFEKGSSLPREIWFFPTVFAFLGLFRAMGNGIAFESLHQYIMKVEKIFSAIDDPEGWEHYRDEVHKKHSFFGIETYDKKALAISNTLFWIVLISVTILIGVYGILYTKVKPSNCLSISW